VRVGLDVSEVPEISEVQILALNRGDILVFKTSAALSDKAAERVKGTIKERIERIVGFDVSVLVLEEGASIEILREKVIRTMMGWEKGNP
jgi:hypothetical protein